MLAFAMPSTAMNMVMEMGVAEQADEPAPTISVDANVVSRDGPSLLIRLKVPPSVLNLICLKGATS